MKMIFAKNDLYGGKKLYFMALCFIIIILFANSGLCQDQRDQKKYTLKSKIGFIENKGQIYDQNFKPNPVVRFLLASGCGLNVQLKANSFSYDTYIAEKVKSDGEISPLHYKDSLKSGGVKFSFHRVDVELPGANPWPEIIAEEPYDDYLNFYNSVTSESGATYVRYYKKVIYKEIYPGIDLEFIVNSEGEKAFEYNFIVHAGADVSKIRVKYHGAIETLINEGKITVFVAHGSFYESIPMSQLQETKKNITVNYQKTADDEFGFQVPEYDINQTLIIDPVPALEWGTYYGGTNSDVGNGITVDVNGNIYVTGITQSNSAIATSGAYRTTGIDEEAFLVKLNSAGQRQWGTYFGGNVSDGGNGIAIDYIGNVLITGYTNSTTGIATTAAHQTSFGGGNYDAFIAKFNNSGQRQWSTYLGGGGWDEGKAIATDKSGNILITGFTQSNNGISTSGSHQSTWSGSGDAFIVKFNSSGKRVWGTYYGKVYVSGITTDKWENIIITGSTGSSTGIATVGAYQTLLDGVPFGGNALQDAIIVKFNSSGQRLWGTYFGGLRGEDGKGIATDLNGNIYVTGFTASDSLISTPGSFQPRNGNLPFSQFDAFIVKFNGAGQRQWGTYYGGLGWDFGQSIACDLANNVIMTGYTQSINNISSPGSHQTVFGGETDAFIVKFNSSGSRLWATYFGGNDDDEGRGIASFRNKVLLTGTTSSLNSVSTTGAHQINYGNGSSDAFIASFISCTPIFDTSYITTCDSFFFNGKYRFLSGVYLDTLIGIAGCDSFITLYLNILNRPKTIFSINDSAQCLAGNFFSFTNSSYTDSGSIRNFWYFGDNQNSQLHSPSHSYSMPGNYSIKLVTLSDYGCKDSMINKIIVNSMPVANFFINDSAQCFNENAFVFYDSSNVSPGLIQYNWAFGDGHSINTTQKQLNYSYKNSVAQIYPVRMIIVSGQGCADTVVKQVVINPSPKADILVNDTAQCFDNQIFVLTDLSFVIGDSISHVRWSWDSNLIINKHQISINKLQAGLTSLKLLVTSVKQCSDSIEKHLIVRPSPQAFFNVNDTDQCYNEQDFIFTNQSTISSGNLSSRWYVNSDSFSSPNLSLSTLAVGTNRIKLLVSSVFNCKDSFLKTMIVFPSPAASFVVNDSTQCFENNNFDFQETSILQSGSMSFEWLIDKTVFSTSRVSGFKFGKWGKYPVRLLAMSNNACYDTAFSAVYVFPQPVSAFNYQNNCLKDTIWFFDKSHCDSGIIVDRFWNFGNGNFSQDKDAYFVFGNSGQNPVTLTTTSSFGCKDDTSLNVFIPKLVSAPDLDRVTVESDQFVMIEWNSPTEGIPLSYRLEKSTDSMVWNFVSDFNNKINMFKDIQVQVDHESYFYRLTATDSCHNTSSFSNLGTTILLTADIRNNFPFLSWSPYYFWNSGIEKYELEIASYPDGANPVLKQFVPVESFQQPEIVKDSFYSSEETNYCYRIVAFRNQDKKESVSNEVCFLAVSHLFIPNVFSPNNDGFNDVFKPSGMHIVDYKLQIFSRWGEKIFESNDINFGWNGRFREAECPVGSYFYQISALGTNGNYRNSTGSLLLVR